jgi:hypothetical protein
MAGFFERNPIKRMFKAVKPPSSAYAIMMLVREADWLKKHTTAKHHGEF